VRKTPISISDLSIQSSQLEPLVVLTGAGISAESGVPTFRGKGGLWEDHRAEDLATPQAFAHDPMLVWRFYNWRRALVAKCAPNTAHHILVEIENHLKKFTLITQNIDGLHKIAGSQHVIEMHGSLWRMRCTHCQNSWEDHQVHPPEYLPHCQDCGTLARPDVIWFGEPLDEDIFEEAMEAASQAQLMLVIGTSAIVHPAATIPMIARSAGARLVEINPESTPLTPHADLALHEVATKGLMQWWDQVRRASE
jgi:NAD-dependent deacetylase